MVDAPVASAVPTGLIDLAHALADAARHETVRRFRTPLAVSTKSDHSPVTEADQAAEAAMRQLINAQAPEHGIYGEEHGQERTGAEYLWVLDPIDGTKSFITGSPLWGTLVALLHQGQPVLGLVDMPVLGERWVGTCPPASRSARCNGAAVRVRDCRELAQARIQTTSPDAFATPDWARFDPLSRRCALRRFGGDCYSYAQLAGGHVDLVVEAGLQPYDYLPVLGVVEGAGGVMTDWEGRPLSIHSDGRVVAAATPALHAAALQALREEPASTAHR